MVLTSSKKSNFIIELDFLAKLNMFKIIFKKYEISVYLWKVDFKIAN